MRQISEGSPRYRYRPPGCGRGPLLHAALGGSTAVLWMWVNRAIPHEIRLFGASELLTASRSLSCLQVLVQHLCFRDENSEVPGPSATRNRIGTQIQSPRPTSTTLSIWPEASTSRGRTYVSNTCLFADPETVLAWAA